MWHSKEGAGAAKLRQPPRPAVCWKTSSLVMEQSSGKQKRFRLSLCGKRSWRWRVHGKTDAKVRGKLCRK